MRLGAIHRPQPLAVRPLSRRASLHLITPPPSADWHAKCPADGDALSNDKYGCCVPVADYRILQMRKANLWGDPTKPLVSDILGRYSALTGFSIASGKPDTGTDTVADMQSWFPRGSQAYCVFLAAVVSIASTIVDAQDSATSRRYFSATSETHPALTTKS